MAKRELLVRHHVKEELKQFKHLPLLERLAKFEEFKKTLHEHDKAMFDKILADENRMVELAEEEARKRAEEERLRKEEEMKRRVEHRRKRELELQEEMKRQQEAKKEEEEYAKKHPHLFSRKK